MFLTCVFFLAAFAGAVLSLIGLISFRRAHSFAVAKDLEAGRAALRTARRTMIAGQVALAIALPGILFSLGAKVPVAQLVFLSIIPVLAIVLFVTILLVVDLRLKDLLQPTPDAGPEAGVDESVTFDLTPDHLWRGQLQWQLHSRLGRITLALAIVAILAVVIGLPLLSRAMAPRMPLALHIAPALVALGIVGTLLAAFGKQIYVATAGRRPGILCEHTLDVRADGLRERTHANDTLWRWSDVREITETTEYVMVRVSTLGLFAIPRTAFGSDDHARRFVAALRNRIPIARGATAPTPG